MAKTDFTYACGHKGRADGRNRVGADRRAKYSADQDCWECTKAAQAASAAEAAREQALPPLTGTSKQIAWAETLRQDTLAEMARTRDAIISRISGKCSDAAAREVADALALLDTELRAITEARRWIDDRDTGIGRDRWIIQQLQTRHLCPTLEAEEAARRAAQKSSK